MTYINGVSDAIMEINSKINEIRSLEVSQENYIQPMHFTSLAAHLKKTKFMLLMIILDDKAYIYCLCQRGESYNSKKANIFLLKLNL